jgi:CBS-domain-containing membrane protein
MEHKSRIIHRALPVFHVPDGTRVVGAQAPPKPAVTLESPATSVLTDLAEVRAAVVHPAATLADAERVMIQQGVRLLFVVREMPAVSGIVTLNDLHGERPVRMLQERRVRREALLVQDVMTPLSELDAVDYALLRATRVGDIVATLLRFGHRYLIVVEEATAESPAVIRGLVSQSQVEKQLGEPLQTVEVATSFAAIHKALS